MFVYYFYRYLQGNFIFLKYYRLKIIFRNDLVCFRKKILYELIFIVLNEKFIESLLRAR